MYIDIYIYIYIYIYIISQLRSRGIHVTARQWLESYLSNITQTVCICGDNSRRTLASHNGLVRAQYCSPFTLCFHEPSSGSMTCSTKHLCGDDTQLDSVQRRMEKLRMTLHNLQLTDTKTETSCHRGTEPETLTTQPMC